MDVDGLLSSLTEAAFAVHQITPRLGNTIRFFQEGMAIDTFGWIESDRIHLRMRCHLSAVTDFQFRKLRYQSQDVKSPLTHLREMVVETSAVVKSGETLLLCPLVRDGTGEARCYW